MERELILALKINSNDKKAIECEIENVKKTFPYTESFDAFQTCNEVFDINNHRVITEKPALKCIFKQGKLQDASCYIFCLN